MAKAKLKEITNTELNTGKMEKVSSLDKLKIIGEVIEEDTKQEEITKEKNNSQVLVNIKMPESKKDEITKFFGSMGISRSAGIRMCVTFVMNQVENGNFTMTESGIYENKLNKLK